MRRDAAEILLDLRQRFFGLEVAYQRQYRVVRRIINAKEILDVLHAGGVEIFHGADDRVLIREVIVHGLLRHFFRLAVGLVVDAQPPLFLHCIALIVEIGGADDERAHAIGFEKQAEVELIGGERLKIIRAIFGGGAVHLAAIVFDQDHVLAFTNILRTLKHHVFEQMREPGPALPLIVRPDVVSDRNGVSGRGVILRQHYTKPVIELMLLDGNLERFGLRLRLDERHTQNKHKYGGSTQR